MVFSGSKEINRKLVIRFAVKYVSAAPTRIPSTTSVVVVLLNMMAKILLNMMANLLSRVSVKVAHTY